MFAGLLAFLCLLAPPSRAQSDEEIQAQTRQIQAEINAIREANAKRDEIEAEMSDIRLDLEIIDGCLNKSGVLIAGPLGMGCMAVSKEDLTKAVLRDVLEGKLAAKDVAYRIRDVMQVSRQARVTWHEEREDLARKYENARLRLMSVRTPSSSASQPQPPTPAQPAQAQNPNEHGGCVMSAVNSCAYVTPDMCAGFKGRYCGASPTNPCHPVNGINTC